MKRILLLFGVLSIGITACAQSIVDSLEWAIAFEDEGLSALKIETDSADQIYFAGIYEGCDLCLIKFGSETLHEGGNDKNSLFLAKFDEDGNLIQSKLLGEKDFLYLSGFEIDHNNQLIVFIESFDFPETANSTLEDGHHLIKLDQDLNQIWDLNIKGAQHNFHCCQLDWDEEQISITESNDIVIGGSVNSIFGMDTTIIAPGDTLFETIRLPGVLEIGTESVEADTNNIYMAKISDQGILQWVNVYESAGFLYLASVDATFNEDIYVLGHMRDSDWVFGNDTLKIDTSSNVFANNLFILKLDAGGNPIWARTYFDDINFTNTIDTDGNGDLIITGEFDGSLYINQDTIFSVGISSDIFIGKLNPAGQFLWLRAIGDQTSNFYSVVETNSEDEIYLSGGLSSNLGVIMAKFSSEGSLIWELNPTQSSNRRGLDLAFDFSGNLIHTGVYLGDFVIGDITLSQPNFQWQQFIVKYRGQSSDLSTSSNDLKPSFDHQISLSPNPSLGKVQIQIDYLHIQGLTLFNAQGHLVWQDMKPISGSQILDFSFLSPGFYSLQLRTDAGMVVKKLVISQ